MFDASLWALVGLILFFVLLWYLKVPGKVGAMLDQQADNIRQELEGARKLREEAQALMAEYQRKRKEAEAEADKIVADAKVEADRLAEEARAALEEMIARRTKAAEAKIAQAESNAIAEVRSRAADVAAKAAETIVTSSTAKAEVQDKVLKQSIRQVSDNLN